MRRRSVRPVLVSILCLAMVVFGAGVARAASAGTLLWQDEFDLAGRADAGFAVTTAGGRAFAAGRATNQAGNADFLVRAYDAATGALLWQDVVGSPFLDSAEAVTAGGGRVVASGVVQGAR